jgi:DNA-binding CsgD family transcriptional regulator
VESSEDTPTCLEVRTAELTVGDDRFLVLSYALPRWQLPRELTRAERDVVQAVLEGASRSEIARRRGTSSRTIANLLANAFRKLGVQSKIELAAKLTLR